MKETARIFHLFSDETRLRMLMLLTEGEFFVCKMVAVLGVSQPLVSRNLAMLRDAGVLTERREKKLVYYSVRKELGGPVKRIMEMLKTELMDDEVFVGDLMTLRECHEFQRRAGVCDMKTFLEFMKAREKRNKEA